MVCFSREGLGRTCAGPAGDGWESEVWQGHERHAKDMRDMDL